MAGEKIPFFTLDRQHKALEGEIRKAILQVFKTGMFIGGPEVAKFEREFARWVGAKYAVSAACGFDSLELSLMALGIGRGDEVIIAANGCPATPMSIRAVGATPVFVDCDDSLNIDPALIEERITGKTRAILPVHLYGRPADMTAVMDIARRRGIKVIEDCAQAHGAVWKGFKAGTFGDLACFSFYPTKNLGGAGDAGIVLTSNATLASKVRRLANYGEARRFDSRIFGINSRMDAVQAAFLRVKLRHLTGFVTQRRKIAAKYIDALKNKNIVISSDPQGGKHAYHLFVVETTAREKLRARFKRAGIGCDVHYPIPFHLLKVFRGLGYKRGDFPRAEKAARRILSLPIFPELKDAELKRVVSEIKKVIG